MSTSLAVAYCVPSTGYIGLISIDPNISVLQLAELIRTAIPEGASCKTSTLEIYKANEEWFSMPPDDMFTLMFELKDAKQLQYLPYPKAVRSFLESTGTPFYVIVFPFEPSNVLHKRSLVREPRELAASDGKKVGCPSYASKPSELAKTQKDTCGCAIYNGRPLELSQPPIAIWHPVFAKFRRLMSVPAESRRFTPEQLDNATRFIMVSSELYPDEKTRQANLENATPFPWLDCFHERTELDGSIKPDGGVVTFVRMPNMHILRPYSMFIEIKNEIGTGGTDPLMQAQCVWRAMWSSDMYSPLRKVSCCPAFLVGIAGPYIAVSGALLADRFICEPLLDYTLLGPHFSSSTEGRLSAGIRRVAHLVDTLEQCVHDLEEHYQGVQNRLMDPPMRRGPLLPPHFTRFITMDEENVTLEYTDRLSKEYSRKAVFTARAEDMAGSVTTVVVKFTATYNQDAHIRLAQEGLAPKLWFCERVADVGGLYVVVMDYMEYKSCDDMGKTETLREDYPGAIQSLRQAIHLLHEDGLVFGDLREPNVLVRGSGTDASAMLIDFDWCGKEGEVRYPCEINLDREAIQWHKDVYRDGYMKKEHDEWMFEILTGERL